MNTVLGMSIPQVGQMLTCSVFMSEQAKLWEAHTRRSKEIIGGPRIANSSNGNTTSKGMAQDPIGLILLVHLGGT